MMTKYAFEHNGDWHFSTQPESDKKIRDEKWEFLRTHTVKYYYKTDEELEMNRCIYDIENMCVDRSIKINQ